MTTRIVVHHTYKTPEPANAGEVATSQPSTGTVPAFLSSLRTFRDSLVAWITATVHAAGALRDRVADWLREISGEIVIDTPQEPCSDCGRPCSRVNLEIPTAPGCAGPLFIGFCDVCMEHMETTPEPKCPHSPYHRITNSRRVAASVFRGNPATK